VAEVSAYPERPIEGTVEDPPGPAPVDGVSFRGAMRLLAGGVVMITSRVGDRAWGMTVSACSSLSADPPQLLVCVRDDTVTAKAIAADGVFGVSILGVRHRDVAQLGAAPGQPKFVDAACFSPPASSSPDRLPRVVGALCHLDCAVKNMSRIGDHQVIVGLVTHTEESSDHRAEGPLVYFDRGYRRLLLDSPRA
jgi:flavin reductase (DIM6/NTAB) family NADH-FMN oxidoreductase RutF